MNAPRKRFLRHLKVDFHLEALKFPALVSFNYQGWLRFIVSVNRSVSQPICKCIPGGQTIIEFGITM